MTNREWLESLPKAFYELYNNYYLNVVHCGDFDRYYKWLDQHHKEDRNEQRTERGTKANRGTTDGTTK